MSEFEIPQETAKVEKARKKHAYYLAHKDQWRAAYRKYREAHREKEMKRSSEYKKANAGAVAGQKRIHERENAEHIRPLSAVRSKRFRENNLAHCRELGAKNSRTQKGRLRSYKLSAKQRGIEFSLSEKTFFDFWQKPCSYCGGSVETIGLDRVDNSVGYMPDNVVSCCKYCNYGKRTRTPEEYIDHCHRVAAMNPMRSAAVNG